MRSQVAVDIVGEPMYGTNLSRRIGLGLLITLALLIPAQSMAYSGGIAGTQSNAGSEIGDVAQEGCLCHSGAPSNSVQVIAIDVPYNWVAGQTYEFSIQLVGGPAADTTSNTAGIAMRVSDGILAAGVGSESALRNWQDEATVLVHESAGATTEDRTWNIAWTAPASGSGDVFFWITGNSVDGDHAPNSGDMWNTLSFPLSETSEDSGRTRTLFAGDGNVEPPAAAEGHVNLHDMGAPFRAHWLGLLGFNAVIMVIVFSGLMLRYGFSTSYKGRTNLLRLRYKTMRRGDQ